MIRTVQADAGFHWLRGGWAAFKNGGGVLIGMCFLLLLIVFIARVIPYLGPILAPIVGTFLYAGILLGLRQQAAGVDLRVDALFSALRDQDKMVHIAIVALVPVLGSVLQSIFARGFIGWLIGALVTLAVIALTYFAVPLVLFQKRDAISAMKLSLEGVTANIPAVIVYWIIVCVLTVLALLPLGLGLLVLIPVLLGATYEAYAEVYGDIELDPSNAPPGDDLPPPPPGNYA